MRHCFVVLFLWVAGIKKIRGRNTNLVAVSPFTLTMNVMLTGKEHVEGAQGSSQSHRQCKSTGTLQYLYLQRRLLPSRLILCLLSKPQFLLKISQVQHKKTYAVLPYNCFWYLLLQKKTNPKLRWLETISFILLYYRHNCVPLKAICWSSNSQRDYIWS